MTNGFARRMAMAAGLAVLTGGALAGPAWSTYDRKPDDWYRSAEGRRFADNILSWQTDTGAWPKNGDTVTKPRPAGAKKETGTFDNGATTSELHVLARAARVTGEARYRDAYRRGIDLILKAQYPTGGWPQYHPPGRQYHRHITFNDGTMVRILETLREAGAAGGGLLDDGARQKVRNAFDLGVACILKCQVRVNGRLTAWCAQHDEIDLSPRPARSYELVSLSGGESAGILRFLMSLDNPSPEVRRAVEAGAAWYESAKITGLRETRVNGDKRMVKDPSAPPLWARFYEIETNRPFFSGRDGVKKYDIAEIEAERRNGYSWYGGWGAEVARDFADWKKRTTAPGGR